MLQTDRLPRLVVDMNVWVGYLLTPRFRLRCDRLFSGEYVLLFSDSFFQEFHETMSKPNLINRLSKNRVDELLDKIHKLGTMIDVHSVVRVCRDPDDDYLLALTQDGAADYLITRDEDLLSLKMFGKTQIITLYDLETMPHN
jgi:putative PIN family toxin of toxin-antitoxin system